MFRNILSCISQLWDLLRESMSSTSTPTSQIPPSSPLDSMPSTINSQTQPSTTIASTSSRDLSASYSTHWDVFLSFRGSDTRNKFTSHLYDKLDSNGIRTFKDDPELSRGEVISDALLDAIRKSKTYIVVISENYASSSWCLDELAEIINCYKTMQRLVIPVFYNIEPSVVRHQTGSFQQAFQKHHVRFEIEKVNNWRLTLTAVANFSGYHVSENRSEADVINEIVDELLVKINPKTLDVAKYPVGLDSHVKTITTLLSSQAKGVIKFGIYGMGGVGKTTLAKALFNQLVTEGRFRGSCFLANVRENSGTSKGLVSLQEQLINDVLRSATKVEVHNVDQGIKLIEDRICSTKVVVVIDDLDDLKQFQSLVGPFASESVVIITTRDEEILIKTEVEARCRYMVNTLDDADSLALFMRHAFGIAEPNDTLMKLSKDILCLAGGLPLALEVFGSYLYKRSEVGWKYYIEKLHRNPSSSIQQRLEISLDALESDDPNLKKIFLDIACCFNGWEKQDVVKIIESYYSHADHYIDMLKKRCLLTIDTYDRLRMHDLLQDLGKEIAHNNSHEEPGKHSRLWVTEDIQDVLKNHKGTEAIECIIFRKNQFPSEEIAYNAETFERMSKLRFLYLKKTNLTGSFEHTLDDLRWLCWDQCPLECLPSGFYPQNLVILELPYSNMRTMWELNMVIHVLGKLKALNMKDSTYLTTTPDFRKLPSLETLNLQGCNSLEQVHVSIGSLVKLVSLNLLHCWKLRSLPDTICHLRALQVLTISHCHSLKALPIQLGHIKSLRKINADGLNVLELPDSIGHLNKLVELNLSNNKLLETLPDTICMLRSLEILNIAYCSHLEALPTAIGNIEVLKMIYARELSVSKLPYSVGRLTKLIELDLSKNKKLETLPDTICNLRSLESLNIASCSSLESLPTEFGNIESLTKLKANSLTVSKLPDSIGHLTKLGELDLSNNKNLETLPNSICNLRSLEILNIEGCSGLEALPTAIGNIGSLKKINVTGLTVSKFPDSIGRLSKIVELDLSYNMKLETLPNTICNLTSLETLSINGCEKLEILPDQLWKITRLTELNARLATGLKKLPDLVPSLSALSLQKLDLLMSGITALPSGFSQLLNLQSLYLSRSHDLLSIPELPLNLKWITASDCTSMERLPNLSSLKQLETLDLSRCRALTEIRGLEELTALRELYLKDCSGLEDIQGLEELTSIRILRLKDSDSLLAYKLTKRLFQVYSEFGHTISVYAPEIQDWHEWPGWITESPYWTRQSRRSEPTIMYAHLLPNESHNFMGIILLFKRCLKECSFEFYYSVKNTTSGFIWRDKLDGPGMHETLMVLVPKSIFSITYDDHKIKLIANQVKIVGIHLLYKIETEMIDDVVKKHESRML